jgi:hypothetical protein
MDRYRLVHNIMKFHPIGKNEHGTFYEEAPGF